MTSPTDGMPALDHLFENNRRWAAEVTAARPDFFQKLAAQQAPEYLWIGCSDSRVPANEIVGLLPGEMFVHRNVANVVVHTDLNCLSVLQYAVDVLKVQPRHRLRPLRLRRRESGARQRQAGVDRQLAAPRAGRRAHAGRGARRYRTARARVDRLCELNVIEQARHVCETTVVQDAWERGQVVKVHAWIYGLRDGRLSDLGFDSSNWLKERIR